MWILVAEAMGALSCLLLIVWWTLGPTQRRERDAMRAEQEAMAAASQTDPERSSNAPIETTAERR
jgi:hypothetical protein